MALKKMCACLARTSPCRANLYYEIVVGSTRSIGQVMLSPECRAAKIVYRRFWTRRYPEKKQRRDNLQMAAHHYFRYGATTLLSSEIIERIASAGLIQHAAHFREVMGHCGVWDCHGAQVFGHVSHLYIPAKET
ncbi:hypothetical protein BOTBODRAFT_38700 [Botryobasidium botryosum FD-172 SS1]|uniref:Uncharacterized protein n=1 Tax=Botryobasidium botryosum (strain FD-172 SS1) TaxID=930990 RepID=A0A067LVX5_BOTB1|nr:hypothetical protein BOTBODRAFT_38700 [Botryobasidium botryosum FD-172 SS1]